MAYKPGDKAPDSGIYKVVHDRNHKQPHEITMIKGKEFPPCPGCTSGPQYTLVRKTEHLRP
jgi:hypothetical protein